MGVTHMTRLEMTPLMISTEQMIALHGFFAEAAAVGETSLGEITGCETEVEVQEVRATALVDFGDRGLCLSDDMIAGVMGRLEGVMPGTANLVLEPEEALLWARLSGGEDPLSIYVELGKTLLEGVATFLAEVLEGEVVFDGLGLSSNPSWRCSWRLMLPWIRPYFQRVCASLRGTKNLMRFRISWSSRSTSPNCFPLCLPPVTEILHTV